MKLKYKKIIRFVILFVLIICFACLRFDFDGFLDSNKNDYYQITSIPEYDGNAYVYLNDNIPVFDEELFSKENYEFYSDLDELGRCGFAIAIVNKYTMPSEERESIGNIKPSGWHTVKYDIVNGKYLYNRCHLIGYQLTGENANEKNLITCTRYMNATTMLDFENEIASYIEETGNSVLYRVTPYYNNNDLVAFGVQLEAYSIEDSGKGIKFNVFIYNVQPGIKIDYSTGDSSLDM